MKLWISCTAKAHAQPGRWLPGGGRFLSSFNHLEKSCAHRLCSDLWISCAALAPAVALRRMRQTECFLLNHRVVIDRRKPLLLARRWPSHLFPGLFPHDVCGHNSHFQHVEQLGASVLFTRADCQAPAQLLRLAGCGERARAVFTPSRWPAFDRLAIAASRKEFAMNPDMPATRYAVSPCAGRCRSGASSGRVLAESGPRGVNL